MSDDPELAAIQERDACFEKEHMRVYGRDSAFDAYAISDRRTLLRRLDALIAERDALRKYGRHPGDTVWDGLEIGR